MARRRGEDPDSPKLLQDQDAGRQTEITVIQQEPFRDSFSRTSQPLPYRRSLSVSVEMELVRRRSRARRRHSGLSLELKQQYGGMLMQAGAGPCKVYSLVYTNPKGFALILLWPVLYWGRRNSEPFDTNTIQECATGRCRWSDE
jgi:hypothetical protein